MGEWTIVKIIIELASQEEGENMMEPGWSGARQGAITGFHVPITWKDDLPRFGQFQCVFISEQQDYALTEVRQELAEKYCGRNEDLSGVREDPTKSATEGIDKRLGGRSIVTGSELINEKQGDFDKKMSYAADGGEFKAKLN